MKAPLSGSMIFAGVLLKLGGYGLLHVFLSLSKYGFGFSIVWVVLRMAGGLFASLFHMQQTDLKSLTTYLQLNNTTGHVISKYKYLCLLCTS